MTIAYPSQISRDFADRRIRVENKAHQGFRLRQVVAPRHRAVPIGSGQRSPALLASSTVQGTGPATPETGVMVFSSPENILVRTRTADELLNRYLPGVHSGFSSTLAGWLANLARAVDHELTLDGVSHVLVIRLAAQNPLFVLILSERRKPATPENLRRFDLTPREAEVMNLVMQGKTNWEIGRILELSQRTVDKHMEHILGKFGAENRTTAMRIAMDGGGF